MTIQSAYETIEGGTKTCLHLGHNNPLSSPLGASSVE